MDWNVTVENFKLDTMGDLMALCGVDAEDPNAIAAIHFCHGYFTGLVHFHIVMGRALEGYIYCMKDDQRPTRDQAIAMMVEWSHAHQIGKVSMATAPAITIKRSMALAKIGRSMKKFM